MPASMKNLSITHIKSFVRRQGRFTPRQKQALLESSISYLLPATEGLIDFTQVFNRQAPLVLEIGFGMGHSLIDMAQLYPEKDFIGIEVYQPGIGSVIAAIEEQKITNLRIFSGDAMLIIPNCIADNSLSLINIFFPDPWQKKRHQKRRLIQAPFVELLVKKLATGGRLHLATDWEDYALQMMAVVSDNSMLNNLAGKTQFAERGERALTKYEQRGQRLGHYVWDLLLEKIP